MAGAADGAGDRGRRSRSSGQAVEFQFLSLSVLSTEGPGVDTSVLARSSGAGSGMDCRDQELLQEATWGYREGDRFW